MRLKTIKPLCPTGGSSRQGMFCFEEKHSSLYLATFCRRAVSSLIKIVLVYFSSISSYDELHDHSQPFQRPSCEATHGKCNIIEKKTIIERSSSSIQTSARYEILKYILLSEFSLIMSDDSSLDVTLAYHIKDRKGASCISR